MIWLVKYITNKIVVEVNCILNNKYQNKEYLEIVKPILDLNEFNETKKIAHHGMNRFDHCARVSYYSYKIAKAMRLDFESVAKAGLLHDFFLEDSNDKKVKTLFKHPDYALEKASQYFILNDMEKDIIKNHMFPLTHCPPKYLESWIVDMVDNFAFFYERGYTVARELSTAFTFFFVILINGLH